MASHSRPSASSTSPTSWRCAPAPCQSLVPYNSHVVTTCSTSTSPSPISRATMEEIMTPSDLQRLDAQLDRLYLSHVKNHYQDLADKAAQRQLAHVEYLAQLIEGEATVRENRAIERRIRQARFPVLKTIEDFQWSWPKKINRPQIQNLLSLAFIATNTNAVFISSVGLGRTQISFSRVPAASTGG